MLILGFLSSLKVNIFGDIYCGEIIFSVYLIFCLRNLRYNRDISISIVLLMIWVVQQFVSDLVNNTVFVNSAKGVGAPVLLMLTVLGMYQFFQKNPERVRLYLLGVYIGAMASQVLAPSMYFLSNPWKWGVGIALLNFTVVWFMWGRDENLAVKGGVLLPILVIFSFISMYFDARTLAVFPLIAFAFMFFSRSDFVQRFGRKLVGRGGYSLRPIVFLVLIIFLSNWLFTAVFSSDAIRSMLPSSTAEKMASQVRGEYGMVLGGRAEILASISAFADKPFLGHGSWAEDKLGYQDSLTRQLYNLDYLEQEFWDFGNNLIPVHSYLMGAVVWAGFLAGLFWLYMLRFTIWSLLVNGRELNYFHYLNGVLFLWAILFSPFGASARWSAAIYISVMFFSLPKKKNGVE